jgi:hypothetical protein
MTVWVYAATQAPVLRGRDCCRFEQAYWRNHGERGRLRNRLGSRHERFDLPIPHLAGSATARADGPRVLSRAAVPMLVASRTVRPHTLLGMHWTSALLLVLMLIVGACGCRSRPEPLPVELARSLASSVIPLVHFGSGQGQCVEPLAPGERPRWR